LFGIYGLAFATDRDSTLETVPVKQVLDKDIPISSESEYLEDFSSNYQTGCSNNQQIDVLVQGIRGQNTPRIDVGDISNATALIATIWVEENDCNNKNFPSTVVVANGSQTVSAIRFDVTQVNARSAIEKIYRVTINNPTSSTLQITNLGGCTAASVAVQKVTSAPGYGSSSLAINQEFHRTNKTFTIDIGGADIARDIAVQVPIHEKDNGRIARVEVWGTGVPLQSAQIINQTSGDEAGLIVVNVPAVPANITNLQVKIISPSRDGDSFGVGLISSKTTSPCSCTDPVLKPDSFELCCGETISGDVSSNDSDLFANATYKLLQDTDSGNLNFNNNGTFTYTSTECKVDRFAYEVCNIQDGFRCCEETTVELNVLAKPVIICESKINNNRFSIDNDCRIEVCTGDRLMLSVNPNVSSVNWTGPNGFIQNNKNDVLIASSVTTAHAGIYTATLTNNNGCTDSKNIEVVVRDKPAAIDDEFTVCCSESITDNIRNNDQNLNNPSYTLVENVSTGNLVFNEDGSFTFTPADNCTGVTFRYKVCNDNNVNACCDEATVRINVNPLPIAEITAVEVVAATILMFGIMG